jgi:hypothetical protein
MKTINSVVEVVLVFEFADVSVRIIQNAANTFPNAWVSKFCVSEMVDE